MLTILGTIFSFLSGVAPAISNIFTARTDATVEEFKAMSSEQQAEYVAYAQALSAANASKVQNNASAPAHLMIYLFGLPAALHWGAVFITATFPGWGIAIYALHGDYATAEKDIAESFFILAPTLPLVSALSDRLRGS